MSYAKLTLINPHTGKTRQAPVGYSWTSLLFGWFVPLLRAHAVGTVIWLIAGLCTFGLSVLLQSFMYNKMYLTYLINEGYQVKYSDMPIEIVSKRLDMALPVVQETA